MTAWQLLSYICTALLLQLAAGIGLLVWRRSERAVPASPSPGLVRPAGTEAWSGWREFRVLGRRDEDAAKSQCSFMLQPVDGAPLPAFKPGQYLTFSLQLEDPSGPVEATPRRVIRCYSISDRPDPAAYRITVKRMPAPADRPELPPGAASNHFHDRVRVGDVLQLKAPSGQFFIDPQATEPAVFIAGGIGITPLLSMLRWCVQAQPERRVHLFYGVRSSAEQAFKTTLEALAESHPTFTLNVAYSHPEPGDVLGRDYQHLGYVDLDLLRSSLMHGRHQFYVCGPPPMMQRMVATLGEWGVPAADIHFEAFGPASGRPAWLTTNEPLAASSVSWDVQFTRSGRTLVWDGQDANLLDFAERQGVALDSGCRTGNCGSCETRLLAGQVQYTDPPGYDIAPGHCLLCIGRPQSALVLEA